MNIEALQSLRLPPIRQTYSARDTILYALGLGYGERPTDPTHLQYLFEADTLQAVPSICVVLAHPGFWVGRPELGIDWLRLLHGEQGCEVYAPIPAHGTVRGEYEVLAIEDKGTTKGAVLYLVKRLYDDATGTLLATVTSTYVLRGDGGQGGFGQAPVPPDALPEAAPDKITDIATLKQSALIYRLSGDSNPIHVDPKAAMKAGFPRPILHGLCTFGIATRAVIESAAMDDPARISGISARFSNPVFPGETIRVEMFSPFQGKLRFRARALERDIVVLDRGTAQIRMQTTPIQASTAPRSA